MSSDQFTVTRQQNPTSPQRVDEILAAPGFGKYMTDHMVSIDYAEGAWSHPQVRPYESLVLDPATTVFHYGQAIFEGLKAYRQPDGSIATFRPYNNAARFRASARRLAMPELPDELFVESLRRLVGVDERWVPASGGEESLYLRPFMISTEVALGVHPADEYRYLVLASPAGAYFSGGIKPVSVWLCTEYVRAAPGGTGEAKFAGNYAASLLAQEQAAAKGCDQVVWLDAIEQRYVEEMGGMNLFFVFGDHVVTPELSGSLLAGVTRDSLLTLAEDLGYTIEERRVSTEEWVKEAASGELTEVFACGTAAVITPVGTVAHAGGSFTIADGEAGAVTTRLRKALTDLQTGVAPDPHGWLATLG